MHHDWLKHGEALFYIRFCERWANMPSACWKSCLAYLKQIQLNRSEVAASLQSGSGTFFSSSCPLDECLLESSFGKCQNAMVNCKSCHR